MNLSLEDRSNPKGWWTSSRAWGDYRSSLDSESTRVAHFDTIRRVDW